MWKIPIPSARRYRHACIAVLVTAFSLALVDRGEAQTERLSCEDLLTEAFFLKASRDDVMRCVTADIINERDTNGKGNTALHLAATYTADTSMILQILRLKADTSIRQIDRLTPLHMVAAYGANGTAVSALIVFGADLDERVTSNKTYAPWKGRPFSTWGTSALHLAASRPEAADIVVALLAGGATVDPWDYPKGRTPLHLAAKVPENSAIVDMLIKMGADVNATDTAKDTPLHLAALDANSDLQVIRRLLAAGSDADAVNDRGQTPLQFAAARAKDPEVVMALFDATSDPCSKDEDNRTAWSNIGFNETLKNSPPFWALRQACP